MLFIRQGEYEKGDAAFPLIAEAVNVFLKQDEPGHNALTVTSEQLSRTPEARPFLCFPNAPGISISHSGDIWMCLVSDSRCGVDFQYIRHQDMPGIIQRYFTQGEGEYIEGGGTGQFTGSFLRTEEGRSGRFFDVWARREALGKYEGHGLFGNYPDSAPGGMLADSVYFVGKKASVTTRVYIHEITASMLAKTGVRSEAGFRAAAVTESPEPPVITII